jgi:hypothetical protein
MKTIALFILILFCSGFRSYAQDDSDWNQKQYSIEDFSRISVSGAFRIYLKQGKETGIVVKSPDENVFDHLKVKNWGDELKIYWSPDNFNFDRVALYITFKNLNALDLEGGIKLKTHGYLDIKDIDVYLSGGAKIDMNMKANNIDILGEGGILVTLKGIANSMDIHLSGAGNVNASELEVKDATIEIEGVGTSSVFATKTLDIDIEGVGKVSYSGNPDISKNIEGFGSVSKKE